MLIVTVDANCYCHCKKMKKGDLMDMLAMGDEAPNLQRVECVIKDFGSIAYLLSMQEVTEVHVIFETTFAACDNFSKNLIKDMFTSLCFRGARVTLDYSRLGGRYTWLREIPYSVKAAGRSRSILRAGDPIYIWALE